MFGNQKYHKALMQKTQLPKLSKQEIQRSRELFDVIAHEISENNGKISFAHFMGKALYEPRLGYYTANKYKIGHQGDFTTAPMISSLFSDTFAHQFAQILPKLGEDASIVEFGAGTGQFAVDCLSYLKMLGCLPKAYYIVELSSDLKAQQQQLLKQKLPQYFEHVYWLDALPQQQLNAIVFANEVMDAMPVERFIYDNDRFYQLMVGIEHEVFVYDRQIIKQQALHEACQALMFKSNEIPQPYCSEINLWIKPWIKSIAQCLNKGVIFLCDYGYSQALYYHTARVEGTLQCYYQHHIHSNPLIYVGVQDITAHVNFSVVADAAIKAGFELDGFSTQGNFLIASGITEIYQQKCIKANKTEEMVLSQQVKQLTLATDLAENFKVMSLSYNYNDTIDAFDNIDLSHTL